MRPLQPIPAIRPAIQVAPKARGAPESDRAPDLGAEASFAASVRDPSLETQLTDLLFASQADEDAFATAARDVGVANQAHEELANAVEELRDLARSVPSGELSPPEILAQVRNLKDQIYRVAAQSTSRPPRSRVATSRGALEYPPVHLNLGQLGISEETFDLSSGDKARASAAAAGQALRAIRSMRSHLAQFMVQDLPTAQDAARIARLNAESADSALLWDASDAENMSAETAAQLAKDLVALQSHTGGDRLHTDMERRRLEPLLD